MSDATNSNMQDDKSMENISSALAAEIERGLREAANASANKSFDDSEARMLDAMCDAVIAGRPNTEAALAAANAADPLASLLHTIQAEAHATVKPDTREEDTKLLEEIEKVAEACVTEYSLQDIAQTCADGSEIVVEDAAQDALRMRNKFRGHAGAAQAEKSCATCPRSGKNVRAVRQVPIDDAVAAR